MSDRTEKLGIIVEADDRASGKLKNVKRELAGIGQVASGSRFGSFVSSIQRGASRIKSSLGGAFSHAKRQLTGLLSTPLTALGIGAGILGLGQLFTSSIRDAATFGKAVNDVGRATGLAAQDASALVDTLEKFGITGDRQVALLGRMVKNQGTLGATKKKALAFEKDYGLSLTDSNGKMLDANKLLLKSADYFNNKNIPATKKAAAMSKLWGRSWTELIPLLSKGSAAIAEEERNSIKLTDQQLANIEKYRLANIEFQDSWGDLKVKIGSEVMPLLTDAMSSLGSWFDTHGDDVTQFMRDGVGAVRGIAATAVGVVSGIKAAWDGIPDPVKDFLVKGAIANKTIKFLFGVSLTDIAGGLMGGVAKGLGGALVQAGIGKAFVQPVFVTNPSFGGGGGAPGGAVPVKGGGLSTLGKLFLVGEAIGLVAAVVAVGQSVSDAGLQQAQGIHTTLKESLASPQTAAQLQTKLDAIDTGIAKLKGDPIAAALITGPTIAELERMRADVVAAKNAQHQAANQITTRVEGMRGAMVTATRNSQGAIVAAVRANKPSFTAHINISVPPATLQRQIIRYQSGGGVTRAGTGGAGSHGGQGGHNEFD